MKRKRTTAVATTTVVTAHVMTEAARPVISDVPTIMRTWYGDMGVGVRQRSIDLKICNEGAWLGAWVDDETAGRIHSFVS